MAEGSVIGTYVGAGAGALVILLTVIIAVMAVKRMKSRATKRNYEGIKIVHAKSATWYDPDLVKKVPEQVGNGDSHVEDGLLAVLTPDKRAKSADCLTQPKNEPISPTNLERCRKFSVSANSLCSLLDERSLFDDSRRPSLTLRSSPYIEFNLLWATGNTSLSVYVIRITGLPPSYNNATCSYKVTLHKPDNSTITKASNKVKKITLNPDCLQVFSFPVTLEEAQQSELEIQVHARKSKHFLSKAIGQLQYQLPSNLTADKPVTTSQPLNVNRKRTASISRSPRPSISSSIGDLWGELQVLAQYQLTGRWQGRVKILVIKGHSALLSKDTGSYKVEVIVKKGSETQSVYQTKSAHGPKPNWKTPFIFDVTQDKVNEYRVELNLTRVARMKKSINIGLAVLGLNTTPTGTQHWQDIVAEPNKEITMWHPVIFED